MVMAVLEYLRPSLEQPYITQAVVAVAILTAQAEQEDLVVLEAVGPELRQ